MSKNNKSTYLKWLIVTACIIVLSTIGKDVFINKFFNTQLTTIPNVINLDEKDAIKYLKKSRLKIKVIDSKTDKVGFDKIFIQYPAAGRIIKVNRTIQIWVNSGKGKEVPNLIGTDLLDARSQLQGSDIQIIKIDYLPSDKKYNTILSIYPAPGTKLEINQKISVLVASRKVADPSIMPNLIGLDTNDARVLLTQIGLEIGNINNGSDSTLPINTIISTSPAPGSKVTKGQKISITINTGASVVNEGPSVEEIINRTNQDINNQNVETIINDTLQKIDQKDKQQTEAPTQPTEPAQPVHQSTHEQTGQ